MASEALPDVSDNLDPTRMYIVIDLTPATAGYKPGEKKSLQEYAMLDAQDESLRRWKESLGITSDSAGSVNPDAPKVCLLY